MCDEIIVEETGVGRLPPRPTSPGRRNELERRAQAAIEALRAFLDELRRPDEGEGGADDGDGAPG